MFAFPIPLIPILAIIFGSDGIKKSNRGLATNKGASIAALVLGLVGVVFFFMYVGIMIAIGN